MNFFEVKNILRTGIFVISFAVLTASSGFAQNNANTRADRTDRDTTRVEERDDTDWGWLGLLGLLGLAGLVPKKRRVEVQEFRDTNRPATGAGTSR